MKLMPSCQQQRILRRVQKGLKNDGAASGNAESQNISRETKNPKIHQSQQMINKMTLHNHRGRHEKDRNRPKRKQRTRQPEKISRIMESLSEESEHARQKSRESTMNPMHTNRTLPRETTVTILVQVSLFLDGVGMTCSMASGFS